MGCAGLCTIQSDDGSDHSVDDRRPRHPALLGGAVSALPVELCPGVCSPAAALAFLDFAQASLRSASLTFCVGLEIASAVIVSVLALSHHVVRRRDDMPWRARRNKTAN